MSYAIKFQWHKQERDTYDQTGGEPKDDHATVRLPGMAHGIEADPATDEQVQSLRDTGNLLNAQINAKLEKLGFDHEKFGYFGFYLMDSDGKI